MRAILGQQVTVKAAATLVARVAQRYGQVYACELPQLTRVFPTADKLARARLNGMGIVGSRVAAIKQLARAGGA